LDSHPEIICKGEAHFGSLLEPVVRQCLAIYNAKIPKKGNWSRLAKEQPETFSSVEYSFSDRNQEFLTGEAIKLMLTKWMKEKHARMIGDKSPNNLDYQPLFDRIFPQAKYIYVIRDVRDIIVSGWFFNLNINAEYTTKHYTNIDGYARKVCSSWRHQVTQSLSRRQILGDRFCSLQYEELWRQPAETSERLFRFMGADASRESVLHAIDSNQFNEYTGGRKPGNENRHSFYRKGIIGDWKNHLSNETAAMVELECGALLQQLGYET